MKRVMFSLYFLLWLNAFSTVAAQGFYPDFALVVQLPSYETFMTNLGDSPIRVDGYSITSQSESLSPTGWVRLAASGPDAVAALGPGVSQFWSANPTTTSLFELNPISSATWQPGQSWSIGFPFSSDDPNFLLDAELVISSPDGLLLTNGTVVFSPEQALASLVVVPEPSSHGDFNNDGTVDTADYVVWRKGLGTTYDQSDYGVWRAHFGASLVLSSGSIDPQSLWSASVELLPAVPEPKTLITLLIGFLLMQWRLRRVTT